MKKFFYVAVLALAFVSCAQTEKKEEAPITNATDIVPAAATDVLPAASPVPGLGKVATDVTPAE